MSRTILINGEQRRAETASTIAEMLQSENVDPAARFLAVAINGEATAKITSVVRMSPASP